MTTIPSDSRDDSPDTASARPESHDDSVREAVIIEEPATAPVVDELVIEDDRTVVVEEVAHASATEPVLATDDPGAVRTEAAPLPPQQVVYIQTPAAPRKLGNRGIGALIAALSALVFIALLALITAIIQNARTGVFDFGFLAQTQFFIPMLFFVFAFVLLVLLVNRGAWWAYIVGSVLVALAVYFGTIGLGLLTTGVISNTPEEANGRFAAQLANPFVIASALLAREVSLWFGALISRRGRKLKARNVTARETYERELAERRAQA
jgi:hypothetical protein